MTVLQEQQTDQEQQDPIYNLVNLSKRQSPRPVLLTVTAHSQRLLMEVDTGASLSLISEKTYLSVWIDNDRPPCSSSILVYRLTLVREAIKSGTGTKPERNQSGRAPILK